MNFRAIRNFIKIREMIVRAVQILVGTALLAFAISLFLLPNHISTGGFSGIATITYYMLNIPMGVAIMVLNIPLFIITLIKGGRKSLVNALIGTIMFSIFLDFFDKFEAITTDKLLASIYGGAIAGIGTAILFRANGSTGGTDLLASIVKMFKPDLKRGRTMLLFDIIVVVLNVIFFRDIGIGLYSAVVIFIMGQVIDAFFEGINFSRAIHIISPEYEEIAKQIGIELRRGATAFPGRGMYKKEDRQVLFCVVSRREAREVRRIVRGIDSKAFIVISNAREVFGEGFKDW